MPISATGSSNGFTLVEMMVVLAIVGLMTAVVAVSFPAPEGDLVREGEKFAARLMAARDNAILGNRETAAILDTRGYRFVERDGKAWRELDEPPLADASWREGTTVVTEDGGTVRVGFDSVGMSEKVALVLANGDHRARLDVEVSGAVSIDAQR